MKRLVFILSLSLFQTFSFAQIHIDVPDFTDPAIKTFYQTYSTHVIKCVEAVREKNETKALGLFKDPGEQLVAKEKEMAKAVVKDPIEKQKYIQYAKQVYPYLKEIQASTYYQKIYGH